MLFCWSLKANTLGKVGCFFAGLNLSSSGLRPVAASGPICR